MKDMEDKYDDLKDIRFYWESKYEWPAEVMKKNKFRMKIINIIFNGKDKLHNQRHRKNVNTT